jgi:hypothetical protein
MGAADASEQWTRKGLEVQDRMTRLREQIPPNTGFTPGTTSWRIVPVPPLSSALAREATTPGKLLATVTLSQGWADVLGDAAWEQTTRVWSDDSDEAVGMVLLWGFLDDAVAGRDLRISMRRTNNVWHLEKVEERYHCRRKVSADGRCE